MAEPPPAPGEVLRALRQRVAALEAHRPLGTGPLGTAEAALPLGAPALDRSLGGGLTLGALHEVAPATALHLGAAAGFVLALAARAMRAGGGEVLWIQPDLAGREAGRLYGPGLDLAGLPLARVIDLRVPHERDAAWAMEEALPCRALAAVVGEFFDDRALDLTTLRRLSLAAARHGRAGGLGLVLRHHAGAAASPAVTRFEIAAAPGPRDPFGGLGRPTVHVSLVRNRRGPTGCWLLSWNHHEHVFLAAPSLALAPTALDRPHRASPPAPLGRTG